MYNRIATATVIRGYGECQAYINGVASAEIKRQQMATRAERERARMVEESCNRLRADRLTAVRRNLVQRRRNPIARLLEKLSNTYALIAGTVIVWCMELGLIEDDRDE